VSGGSTDQQSTTGGDSGSSSPTDALPSLPDTTTPSTEQPTDRIELQAPELPTLSAPQDGSALPEVQVPDTGVPLVDETTDGVQQVTDGLQDALP